MIHLQQHGPVGSPLSGPVATADDGDPKGRVAALAGPAAALRALPLPSRAGSASELHGGLLPPRGRLASPLSPLSPPTSPRAPLAAPPAPPAPRHRVVLLEAAPGGDAGPPRGDAATPQAAVATLARLLEGHSLAALRARLTGPGASVHVAVGRGRPFLGRRAYAPMAAPVALPAVQALALLAHAHRQDTALGRLLAAAGAGAVAALGAQVGTARPLLGATALLPVLEAMATAHLEDVASGRPGLAAFVEARALVAHEVRVGADGHGPDAVPQALRALLPPLEARLAQAAAADGGDAGAVATASAALAFVAAAYVGGARVVDAERVGRSEARQWWASLGVSTVSGLFAVSHLVSAAPALRALAWGLLGSASCAPALDAVDAELGQRVVGLALRRPGAVDLATYGAQHACLAALGGH